MVRMLPVISTRPCVEKVHDQAVVVGFRIGGETDMSPSGKNQGRHIRVRRLGHEVRDILRLGQRIIGREDDEKRRPYGR